MAEWQSKQLRSQQPAGEGIEERIAREKRERWEASDEYKAEVEKKEATNANIEVATASQLSAEDIGAEKAAETGGKAELIRKWIGDATGEPLAAQSDDLSEELRSGVVLCTLLNAINDLRLSWPSTKDAQTVHERAFPLQYTLRSMNNSQGLGFCVFGKVVDKKTLNVIGISVVSFVSTAVPLLMAVLVPDAVAREGECALTELEASTIRAVMSNESCSYNMTLDAILAGPGH